MAGAAEGRGTARAERYDASVWVGCWPFRPSRRSLEELEAELAAHGFAGACVASVEAVLSPDPQASNVALLEALAARHGPFRWVGAAVLDPTLAGWEEDALQALDLGARCFKIFPNYHMYPLQAEGPLPRPAVWVERAAARGRAALDALCGLAAARGVPLAVQMRLQDERTHHPRMQVPGVPAVEVAELARRHPRTRFLACGAYLADLAELAKAPNVWVETSMVEGEVSLREAMARVPPERLVLGSHSPLLYTLPAVVKLEAPAVGPEARALVAADNWRFLWPEPA